MTLFQLIELFLSLGNILNEKNLSLFKESIFFFNEINCHYYFQCLFTLQKVGQIYANLSYSSHIYLSLVKGKKVPSKKKKLRSK